MKKPHHLQFNYNTYTNIKINGTPKGVYLAISKLYSILSVPNLLAHNNSWLSYYVKVNSLRLKSCIASKWASKHLWGVSFILLLMVHVFHFSGCALIWLLCHRNYSNIEMYFLNVLKDAGAMKFQQLWTR